MNLIVEKTLANNKTLYRCIDERAVVHYILVHNIGVIKTGFVYDVTVFWLDKNIKRCFLQAFHKQNLLNDPATLSKLFNHYNGSSFPCNAEYGWKDSEISTKDKIMLGVSAQ